MIFVIFVISLFFFMIFLILNVEDLIRIISE